MNFGFGNQAPEYTRWDAAQFRGRVRGLIDQFFLYEPRTTRLRWAAWASYRLLLDALRGGVSFVSEPPAHPRAGAPEPPAPVTPKLSRRAAAGLMHRVPVLRKPWR